MTSVSVLVANEWPRRLQVVAQLLEVVDLAVEDAPDGAVFVAHGLAAGGEVDDAQPAHGQTGAGRHVEALVVRAPMRESAHICAQLGQLSPADLRSSRSRRCHT